MKYEASQEGGLSAAEVFAPKVEKRPPRKLQKGIERAVKKRYAQGAQKVQEALCCPVDYDPKYLKILPREILDKDYGCGDPSRYVREGETVLDLGSGAGKICYIASQIVGPKGRVIGIDFNPAMLKLARKYQRSMAAKIGWNNIDFRWGKIQDLKTDLTLMDKSIRKKAIRSAGDYARFEDVLTTQRETNPLLRDSSVDVIVSNCVLNLVRSEDKKQLFREMFRVLKRGGRLAVSDIVSDEQVPAEMREDTELWSGCISGAFQEADFLKAFEEAGFYGICVDKRDEKPWRTVKGIEFRSVTVTAYKGKQGECWERNQAVIYKGPWRQVADDDQHVLKRGVPTAVCDKTFKILSQQPYRDDVYLVPPHKDIPLKKAKPFDCKSNSERHPRVTKGMNYKKNSKPEPDCSDASCC